MLHINIFEQISEHVGFQNHIQNRVMETMNITINKVNFHTNG